MLQGFKIIYLSCHPTGLLVWQFRKDKFMYPRGQTSPEIFFFPQLINISLCIRSLGHDLTPENKTHLIEEVFLTRSLCNEGNTSFLAKYRLGGEKTLVSYRKVRVNQFSP